MSPNGIRFNEENGGIVPVVLSRHREAGKKITAMQRLSPRPVLMNIQQLADTAKIMVGSGMGLRAARGGEYAAVMELT